MNWLIKKISASLITGVHKVAFMKGFSQESQEDSLSILLHGELHCNYTLSTLNTHIH